MLVLACPCALVIAAPIPAVCAIATAAKNKVLVRGAKRLHLQCMLSFNDVIFCVAVPWIQAHLLLRKLVSCLLSRLTRLGH
jgi:hypothetical protein